MAIASAELMGTRNLGELATIRTLPEMRVLRSVVGAGSDFEAQLVETIEGLPDGMYLLTKGTPAKPTHLVIEKLAGLIDEISVPPEALTQLPAMAQAVSESQSLTAK